MRLPRIGIRTLSAIASIAALALTAIAFTVAFTATADSQKYGSELSQRLVPADAAADDLFRLSAGQQLSLRAAVASGRPAGLAIFRAEGAQILAAQSKLATFARGDAPMTQALDAATRAYAAWRAGVAGPQIAALGRNDAAAARALQADIAHNAPLARTVRTSTLALTSRIDEEQRQVGGELDRAHGVLLGALIATVVVAALIATVVIVGVWLGLLRPLKRLKKAVATVADGGHQCAIPVVGPPEIADMSRGIERMRTTLVSALTERERTEESQRNLFDMAPDAMVAVARDGSIAIVNERAVQMYGYAAVDLACCWGDILLPPEWREPVTAMRIAHFADPLSRPTDRVVKAFGLRKDGSSFPCEARLSWLRTGQDALMLVAVRDISERLAMEAERERMRAAAEQERFQRRVRQSQRLESLGQLVGGVAHDFNNLLNVISGYADFSAEQLQELAASDERLEPVRADVAQIQSAAQQAIRVTRQLLTFSRGESATTLESLDVNEVVKSSGELLRRSLGKRIELIISADPGLWQVEADRGQLEQILMNLSVNARDAMPDGGQLTIGTGNAEVDTAYAAQRPNLKPGRYCRLTVADTGTGMDEATIDRVFEPFFSTKPRGRGTGLGLATVYGIVSSLGGTIDIYSEKGFGTTMNVLLPVSEQGAVTAGSATAEPGIPDEDLRGHGERVLLVEDEAGLRTMTTRILTRNGYLVRAAGDGADAVRLAEDPSEPIDILVTDMVMPGMRGSEVAERVRAVRPRLPALFVTGYARPVLDYHGIRARDVDIVHKPFTEAILLSRVRRSLSQAATPRAD